MGGGGAWRLDGGVNATDDGITVAYRGRLDLGGVPEIVPGLPHGLDERGGLVETGYHLRPFRGLARTPAGPLGSGTSEIGLSFVGHYLPPFLGRNMGIVLLMSVNPPGLVVDFISSAPS